MLPEGWVQVTHNTGIPIYLHKSSRVCTASMPYFLGPGSARVSTILVHVLTKVAVDFSFSPEYSYHVGEYPIYWLNLFQKHKIPISAIPCLQYRKALNKENGIIEEEDESTTITEVNAASASSADDDSKKETNMESTANPAIEEPGSGESGNNLEGSGDQTDGKTEDASSSSAPKKTNGEIIWFHLWK